MTVCQLEPHESMSAIKTGSMAGSGLGTQDSMAPLWVLAIESHLQSVMPCCTIDWTIMISIIVVVLIIKIGQRISNERPKANKPASSIWSYFRPGSVIMPSSFVKEIQYRQTIDKIVHVIVGNTRQVSSVMTLDSFRHKLSIWGERNEFERREMMP
jgi:hypothetical protein